MLIKACPTVPLQPNLIWCDSTFKVANLKRTYYEVSSSVVDPWNFGSDPDPAIFVSGLQDVKKKFFL